MGVLPYSHIKYEKFYSQYVLQITCNRLGEKKTTLKETNAKIYEAA